MTDPDRGAYTPQTDPPLSFDARRPRERRPAPMALIGSAVVLVALVGGVALVYRGGVRGAGDGRRSVGEPVMSVKTAPPAAAQPHDSVSTATTTSTTAKTTTAANPTGATTASPPPSDAHSAQVATAETSGAATSAPVFAPSPEQPAARPAPKPRTVAMLAPAASVLKPAAHPVAPLTKPDRLDPSDVAAAGMTSRAVEPSAEQPLRIAQAGETASHAKLSAITRTKHLQESNDAEPGSTAVVSTTEARTHTISARTQAVKPSSSRPAISAVEADPASAGPIVQIGAFSSTALAERGYAEVSSAMAGGMGGKSRHVQALDHDGKTLFRTWVAGFASRADAVGFCEALKAKSKICIVKG